MLDAVNVVDLAEVLPGKRRLSNTITTKNTT